MSAPVDYSDRPPPAAFTRLLSREQQWAAGLFAVMTAIGVAASLAVSSLDRDEIVVALAGTLALAWLIACLSSPTNAIWGLQLLIPVQGCVQLNVFGNSNLAVLISDVQTCVVYAAVLLQAIRRPDRWRGPRVMLYAVPFVAWFLLLIPYSASRMGRDLILIAVRTYLFPLLLVWVGYGTFRRRRDLAKLGSLVMLQMAGIGVVTVLQYRQWVTPRGELLGAPMGYVVVGGVLRPPGTFASAAHLGMYILAMVPLGIGFSGLIHRRWQRLSVSAGLIGAAVALAVNSQRSAVVQLTVAVPLLFVLAKRVTIRNLMYASILVPVAVVAGAVITGGAFAQRVISIQDNAQFALIEAPFQRLFDALQSPLVGQGWGSAVPGMHRLQLEAMNPAESFMAAIVFQAGVPGLVFF
jgi:hypothetical protein